MNRRYTFEDYYKKVEMLKNAVPNCAITTDIMVGFPCETEEDFLKTYNATKFIRFDGAFTFVYSRRKGTKANDMDGQIDDATKKDRIMRLVELQNDINAQKSLEYVGKTVEVLCEDYDEKRRLYLGRDEFSKMIYFESEKSLQRYMLDNGMIGRFRYAFNITVRFAVQRLMPIKTRKMFYSVFLRRKR